MKNAFSENWSGKVDLKKLKYLIDKSKSKISGNSIIETMSDECENNEKINYEK